MILQIEIDPFEQTSLLFDAGLSTKYEDLPDIVDKFNANHDFLKEQFKTLQLRLEQDGCLFVNDVLDALGFKRTSNGQLLGWTKDLLYMMEHSAMHEGFNIVLIPEGLIYHKL